MRALFAWLVLMPFCCLAQDKLTFDQPLDVRGTDGTRLLADVVFAERDGIDVVTLHSSQGIVRVTFDEILPSQRSRFFDVAAVENAKIAAAEAERRRVIAEREAEAQRQLDQAAQAARLAAEEETRKAADAKALAERQRAKDEAEANQHMQKMMMVALLILGAVLTIIVISSILLRLRRTYGGGSLVALVGVIVAAFFMFFYDTTVATPTLSDYGVSKIHNLEKGNTRTGGIIIGVGLAVVGALFTLRTRRLPQ